MRRRWAIAAVVLGLSVLAPVATSGPVTGQEGAGPPVLADLAITGNGVTMYPNFQPTTRRFGVRTTSDTQNFTITATTASPGDQLTISDQPATSGQGRTFRKLRPGEMLTVRVANGNGERTYDVVFLPPSFPNINVTTREPGIAPGLLYLGFFTGSPFNIVMDNNGVPVFVNRRTAATFDFKPQPGGRYSFLQRTDQETSTGRDIFEAVILNSAMQEVRRVRNRPPLTHTDNHEVILLPGGGRLLMAYEPFDDNGTMREATVVQEVNGAGDVVLQWSSRNDVPLSDNLSGNLVDYSHGNSIDIANDGNLLISLRGTSSVVKVNRRTGRLMWTLGGKSSDFEIDDPLGSFCGQHTAYDLPNGNILMFDNAVDCPPDGHDRSVSRAVEYDIDWPSRTAEVVWSHSQGIFGFATGSTQRFENGNTLIAWGTSGALSEVNEAGDILWQTTPRTPAGAVSATYRIHRAPFPDAIRPRVYLATPARGATFLQGQQVRASYFCADEGGSSLASCDGTLPHRALLDTSTPGLHTVEVTGTDGAGNTSTVTRTYEVIADQPDVMVRNGTSGRLVGNNVYNRTGAGQTRITQVHRGDTAIYTAVVENDGADADTIRVHGSDHNAQFSVRYFDGGRDVTAAVKAGTYRIQDLAPGARHALQVRVGTRLRTRPGAEIAVFVQARSTTDPSRRDTGKLLTRRTGGEAGELEEGSTATDDDAPADPAAPEEPTAEEPAVDEPAADEPEVPAPPTTLPSG